MRKEPMVHGPIDIEPGPYMALLASWPTVSRTRLTPSSPGQTHHGRGSTPTPSRLSSAAQSCTRYMYNNAFVLDKLDKLVTVCGLRSS